MITTVVSQNASRPNSANDKINKQTVEQKLTVEITVVRGHITDENPWGYYVDQIRETVSN